MWAFLIVDTPIEIATVATLSDFLTVGYPGGRTGQLTIRREQKSQVERWLRNYQKLRTQLEALCELNQQLLKAEP